LYHRLAIIQHVDDKTLINGNIGTRFHSTLLSSKHDEIIIAPLDYMTLARDLEGASARAARGRASPRGISCTLL
ncbi:MAG: hypothetical protein V3U27_00590, partial [Candidatus Tectomicrobia bacterium]